VYHFFLRCRSAVPFEGFSASVEKKDLLEITIWLFNKAMENHHFKKVNHLFLWAIYTMAMLKNQRVYTTKSSQRKSLRIFFEGYAVVLIISQCQKAFCKTRIWNLEIDNLELPPKNDGKFNGEQIRGSKNWGIQV
jgi:hypothetical protein